MPATPVGKCYHLRGDLCFSAGLQAAWARRRLHSIIIWCHVHWSNWTCVFAKECKRTKNLLQDCPWPGICWVLPLLPVNKQGASPRCLSCVCWLYVRKLEKVTVFALGIGSAFYPILSAWLIMVSLLKWIHQTRATILTHGANGPPHLPPQIEIERRNSLHNNGITLNLSTAWTLQRCQIIIMITFSLAMQTTHIVTSPPTSRMDIG